MKLTVDEAKQIVLDFCATYPVAAKITYQLRETQEELYGPQATREAVGTLLGAYLPRQRRALFAVANFRDARDFERTLRHEVLGHFGLNTFNSEEKREILTRLAESREAPDLEKYWQQVDRMYPELSTLRKAEEVYAFVCEDIEPSVRSDASIGMTAFQAVCVERSRLMTLDDMVAITTMVAEGLHDRSRRQQIFPATDRDQFRRDSSTPRAEYRTWLAVPHEQRDALRDAAGRLPDGQRAVGWDIDAKLWYAKPGCELHRVRAWLPDTAIRTGGGDAQTEFHDALTRAGLVLEGLPQMDGQRHRVATVEDKKGQKSGVYRGFLDRRPGGWFINYHRAETEKSVTNWKASGNDADPVARLHLRAAAKQAHEDGERAREVRYAQQSEKAAALYAKLPAADPQHPYLIRKGITASPELRQTQNGTLVVPFFNADGDFKTLQYITPQGDKRLFADAPKQGHYLVVGGPLREGEPLCYAEGYATARSLNLATGRPVVMTIDAGNMVAVATVLQGRYPDSPHLFLADNDHAKTQNKGLAMATQAAKHVRRGEVILPAFTEAEKAQGLTDFNDLHQSRGLGELRTFVTDHITHTLNALSEESYPMDKAPEIIPDAPAFGEEGPSLSEAANGDAHAYAAWAAHAGPPAPTAAPQEDAVAFAANGGEQESPADVSLAGRLKAPSPSADAAASSEALVGVDTPVDTPPPRAGEADPSASPDQDVIPVAPASTPLQRVEETEPGVDAIHVGAPRARDLEPEATNIDKDALLGRLTHEVQADKSVLYSLDGEAAFVDRGNRIDMAAGAGSQDEKIIAALLTAAQFYRGRIALTGSDAFKQRAIDLIARHDINVTMKMPAQQAMLTEALKARDVEPVLRDAVTGDALPAWGGHSEATPTPAASVSADEPVAEPAVSPAEQVATDAPAVTPPLATAAHDTPASPVSGTPAAVHQSYHAAKNGVTGKVMDFGRAPFRFEPDEGESVFIKLRTKNGLQTFWGKELAGLLRESRVQKGSLATLQWLGKEAVTVRVPVADDHGQVLRYEEKMAHRNQWSLAPAGGEAVRTGGDALVKQVAFDANRFAALQAAVVAQIKLPLPPVAVPQDGLIWLRPDGQASPVAGDALSAPRPAVERTSGTPVISSWGKDGALDLYLVRSDGPYLQGVVRQQGQYQHVLVSLPDGPGAPPMVFNAVGEEGIRPVGYGNGINRSNGQPVPREHIAFRLEGDAAVRIGKLDAPGDMPPGLHARLGFDERWREDNASPKPVAAATPKTQPVNPSPQ